MTLVEERGVGIATANGNECVIQAVAKDQEVEIVTAVATERVSACERRKVVIVTLAEGWGVVIVTFAEESGVEIGTAIGNERGI